MAWYRAGTVSVTGGSKVVTGSGTAWAPNVQAGDAFHGPDGRVYEIDFVTSDTSATLVENYAGSTVSGQGYKIQPTQGRVRDLAAMVSQLITEYGSLEAAFTVLAGNVGIGTASPSAKLHVAGATSGEVRVEGPTSFAQFYARAASGASAQLQLDSAGGSGRRFNIASLASGGLSITDETAAAPRIRLSAAGNLGIGTNSPSGLLHLASAAADVFQIIQAPASRDSSLVLAGNGTAPFATSFDLQQDDLGDAWIMNRSARALRLGTSDAPRVVIDAAGNVGVGALVPAARLHVTGTVRLDAAVSTSAAGGAATALPAQPVGYLTINISGTDRKVPFYG